MESLKDQFAHIKQRMMDQRNAKKSSKTKRRDEIIKSNRKITDFIPSKKKNDAEPEQESLSDVGASANNSRTSFGGLRSKSKSPTRSHYLQTPALSLTKPSTITTQIDDEISQASDQGRYDAKSTRESQNPDLKLSIPSNWPHTITQSDQDESRQPDEDLSDMIQNLQEHLIEMDSNLDLQSDIDLKTKRYSKRHPGR